MSNASAEPEIEEVFRRLALQGHAAVKVVFTKERLQALLEKSTDGIVMLHVERVEA